MKELSSEEVTIDLLPRLTLPRVRQPSSSNGYSLFVWGSGKDGRCGNGSEDGCLEPTQVVVVEKPGQATVLFSQLSCGYHHTGAVSADG